jgi:hypothetical protein
MLKLPSVAAKPCHACRVRRVRPKPSRKRSFNDSFKLLPYRKDFADERTNNGCINLLREPWRTKGTSSIGVLRDIHRYEKAGHRGGSIKELIYNIDYAG